MKEFRRKSIKRSIKLRNNYKLKSAFITKEVEKIFEETLSFVQE